MHSRLMYAACGIVALLTIEAVSAVAVQAQDLRARCNQLVSYYNRYGSSRGEDTDGNRNFIRIGAEIDCQRGEYEKGIAALEALMNGKDWTLPPPPRS